MPPAAPAPGSALTLRPAAAFSSRPIRSSRSSSSATVSGSAPFCGPNTAAAPIGPSSGCSTSVAAISSTPSSGRPRGGPGRRAPRPCRGRRRCTRCRRARRRCGRAPAASAAPMSWPTPLLWARERGPHASAARRAAPGRRPARTRCRRWPTRRRTPTPRRRRRSSGPLTRSRAQSPEPAGQHVDEAGTAVGLRRER